MNHLARFVCFFLIITLTLSNCKTEEEVIEPRRMEVLFLGHDSEHHNSEEFLPYLASALTPKGINFSYDESPNCLTKANLEKYDALMIYANHDEIKTSQEKALLDFVKNGGGLLPIHCASYCFRNSDEYVELVGGQFESHDTATFELVTTDSKLELASVLPTFSSWDETYVHTKLKDINVLQERIEGDHKEPYTWTKEYGKGRMFYTALGHDLRTWDQADFHELIYQGILWAIGDNKKEALSQMSFPALSYSPAKIANYEKRDPAPQLQAPLSPEESMKLIQVPPDFELELFASEPDIINPIAMNWDHRGRLWILETVDYPNDIKVEKGVGNDRIKILEDTDQDGKADKFTVFADKLSVPTSLVFANGGVIISQAPYFMFLKDTDGDDVADVKEEIMEGWGTTDTHAGPSNLRYGFDNKIWGVVGYSGYKGKVGGKDKEFSSGIYSFNPDGSGLDYLSRTSNNTWGLGISEENDVFISTANNTHSGYYALPESHTKDVEGLHLKGVEKLDGHYLFHPITRNYRQVDVFDGFTAAAGHALYTARDFPQEYWNRVAFVAEPTGHLLHNAILENKGSSFTEADGWNLLASSDEWVSPVAADVGPDGAVWIADWYNFIIQHNPTPPGFENGLGNAHINPLRDKQRGRIYRLKYKEAKQKDKINLDGASSEQLVAMLGNDNMLWRMHAQRLLVESGDKSIKSDLVSAVNDRAKDALGLNNKALHALWTLDGLGFTDEEDKEMFDLIANALSHPAAAVRKAALQILPSDEKALEILNTAGVLEDNHGPVRLAALNKLWELPSSSAVAETLLSLTKDEKITEDLWFARSTYVAAVKHKEAFVTTLNAADPNAIAFGKKAVGAEEIDYLAPALDISAWKDIPVPKWLSHTNFEELVGFSGIFWYRTEIDLPASAAGKSGTFSLPGAWHKDHVHINGRKIGEGKGWDVQRNYKIPRNLLKAGKNIIAVKIEGGGGIGGDEDKFYMTYGDEKLNLTGTWKYKIEKVISSGRSEYADGAGIVDVFLKNYGPYALKQSEKLNEQRKADRTVVIKTIKDQMKYDITEIKATPGEVLKIKFVNDDAMQHNLLLLEQGALSLVGNRAELMAKDKDAAERNYTPNMEEILYKIPMLDPGDEFDLFIEIPQETGDYPYVCTFPGHWQTMNGVLKVVESL